MIQYLQYKVLTTYNTVHYLQNGIDYSATTIWYITLNHYIFIDATCLYIWTFVHKLVLYGYNYMIESDICYFPFVVKFVTFYWIYR